MLPAPERFSPLRPESLVFRLADPGGRFLPLDAPLPLIGWLEPTSEDIADSEASGRPPGVSVWDRSRTELAEALAVTGRATSLGFVVPVDTCRRAGVECGRTVDVVADPLEGEQAALPGADGHALIEGLKRPAGVPRDDHRVLMQRTIESCKPMG